MKTRPPEPIQTPLPTCGEVFHFFVNSLGLISWGEALHREPKSQMRSSTEQKKLHDQLRDWATEANGKVPTRANFESFLSKVVTDLPQSQQLNEILQWTWSTILSRHVKLVRENAAFLPRHETRNWYGAYTAQVHLVELWELQQLLRRVCPTGGPTINQPLGSLLKAAWPPPHHQKATPKHPLFQRCWHFYAKGSQGQLFQQIDPASRKAWDSGSSRPNLPTLARRLEDPDQKLELVLNLALAGLVEDLVSALAPCLSNEKGPRIRQILIGQAEVLDEIASPTEHVLEQAQILSVGEHLHMLKGWIAKILDVASAIPKQGEEALDIRVARLRVLNEYESEAVGSPPPPQFTKFFAAIQQLLEATRLQNMVSDSTVIESELSLLTEVEPRFAPALQGVLLTIQARLDLHRAPHSKESLSRALRTYQRAVFHSRYATGTYMVGTLREAMGLAAWMHRRGLGEGSIRPWLKNSLEFWDLLEIDSSFDHENLDQRIEKVELWFKDSLGKHLRDALKSSFEDAGLNQLGLTTPLIVMSEEHRARLQDSAVPRRQRRPLKNTLIGREQSPLMEAIDRGQLELAKDFVARGDDLNFINSTGDTCITKAFARKAYDLVLDILRRPENPILRETLVRPTDKLRISALEQTLKQGHLEILRKLGCDRADNSSILNLSEERVLGQTPLYYAIACLVRARMSPLEYLSSSEALGPWIDGSKPLSPQAEAWYRTEIAPDLNAAGLLACIRYLVEDQKVNLEALSTNGHTALTYSVERGLRDVVEILLKSGANVGHACQGGETALAWAVCTKDVDLCRLLLDHGASPLHVVDCIGRPIWAMEMPEALRQLIPIRRAA
jgi:ankyrin repeat protein